MQIIKKSQIEYIFEVDLENLDELRLLHNDYSLAPEQLATPYDVLPDCCKRIEEITRAKSYMTSQNYAKTLSIVSKKGTLTTFLKYKCNLKYNHTTTSRSVSPEDQRNWSIHRRSARLKKTTYEHQFN